MQQSPLQQKSFDFALRIVRCAKYLQESKKEYILSKQLLRSGTAIGALISEAEFAQSREDFTYKITVALKEANETKYWLSLLKGSDYINEKMFNSIMPDCLELVAMLVTSVKTTKENNVK
jgi:four helix bundle protein